MLAERLVRVLAAVAADPQAPVRAVQVLDAAERRQVLAGWNDTAVPVPAAGGVHELIAARAAAGPDAVAVVCGGCALTLRGAGGAGGAAGAVPGGGGGRGRSRWWGCAWSAALDLVVAVLAVWQAGAAYLPLDPGYPAGAAGVHAGRQQRGGAGRAPVGAAAGWRRAADRAVWCGWMTRLPRPRSAGGRGGRRDRLPGAAGWPA